MDPRWTRVDAISRPDKLGTNARCYYYTEYTPRAGWGYSDANQRVLNYKISPSDLEANPARLKYKLRAIDEYASAIVGLISSIHLRANGEPLLSLGAGIALLPVPPSVPLGHEGYDDRNVRTCDIVSQRLGIPVCRDIETTRSIGSSHAGGTRDPLVIEGSLDRVGYGCNNASVVFIVDDTLVSGAHYTAICNLLGRTGCSAFTCGIFLARSIS